MSPEFEPGIDIVGVQLSESGEVTRKGGLTMREMMNCGNKHNYGRDLIHELMDSGPFSFCKGVVKLDLEQTVRGIQS